MKDTKHSLRERGFGVLEVLIAVAVLSIALLSLGGLHSKIIQSSSAAKARTIASSLMQEKLDDLRSYKSLASGGNGDFGYAEIAANAGGAENADGTLKIPSGSITISNIAYDRTWSVTDYYYCAENAAPSTTNSCSATTPSFKLIAMAVSWTDREGAQSMQFQTAVAGMDPSTSGQSGINAGHGSPVVGYTPLPAPDVVRVGLGDSKYKEATKPDLDVSQHGHSTVTSFDEITYSTTNETKTRDSFLTTSCICALNSGTGTAYNPTRFDGEQFVVGDQVTKKTGALYTDGNFGDQHDMCGICCRDHHDKAVPSTDTTESCTTNPAQYKCVYDPYRPSSDYTAGGDHKHYYSGPSGLTEATADGALYYESCRMVRVNGFLRVAQDWRQEALNVMPNSYLTSTTNYTNYAAYVTAYIKAYIQAASALGTNYPATAVAPSSSELTTAITTAAIPSSYTMNASTTEQFHGRGIYIDYMDSTLLASLKSKIDNNESFLGQTPFHEVNLTKIGGWSSSNTAAATITNDVLVDSGSYSRGNVTTTAAGGSTDIVESDERGNSGLTDGPHTDPTDSSALLSDTIALTGTAPATPRTVTGTITIDDSTRGSTGRSQSQIKVYCGNDTDPPTTYTADTNAADSAFSCSLDSNGAGYIYITSYLGKSQGNTIDNCVKPETVSGVTVSTNNDGFFGEYSPTGSGSTVTTAEFTRYRYTGVVSNQTLNITIQKENSGGQCN
jgi:Tfp pilus assembly protein PilV